MSPVGDIYAITNPVSKIRLARQSIIYRSSDNGDSWSPFNTGIPPGNGFAKHFGFA